MKNIVNLTYRPAEDGFGTGDLYLPETAGASPAALLLIHGGGWGSMDKSGLAGIAEFLSQDLNLAVFNVDYRLCGKDPWPAGGDDCMQAGRFLLDADIPEFQCLNRKKIWVMGASSGGHLALMTGLRLPPERVAGIISISGIAAVRPDYRLNPGRYRNLFGHDPSERELDLLEPSSLLTRDSPPVLLTHGLRDNVVPISSAECFLQKLVEKQIPSETFFYAKEETGFSHRIWIPGSSPHKLYPELEKVIAGFIAMIPEN